jgi:GNAT superfamily N-acetyltransferase
MTVVRTMTSRDVGAVAELGRQLGYDVDSSTVEAALPKVIGSGSTVLVAEAGGRVVGWIHGYESVLVQYPRPFAEVGGLVVDESERGSGIGRALVDAIEQWAATQGLSEVRLRSGSMRQGARTFYESLGYLNEKSSYTFSKRLK